MQNDYVKIPREIKRLYIDKKITLNEFLVLLWIFLNTNPYDGRHEDSYESLVQTFRGSISLDNMRKIISSLRRHNWIWYESHRGRGGKFTIYPLNFSLTNKHIQNIDDFLITPVNRSKPKAIDIFKAQPNNNSMPTHHNLQEQRNSLIENTFMTTESSQITTTYNKNENDINNDNKSVNNFFKEKNDAEQNVKGREQLKKMINDHGVLKID